MIVKNRGFYGGLEMDKVVILGKPERVGIFEFVGFCVGKVEGAAVVFCEQENGVGVDVLGE